MSLASISSPSTVVALAADSLDDLERRTDEVVRELERGADDDFTQFAARTLSGTKFEAREAPDLAPIHARLQRFTELGGRIEVCGIALDRSAIAVDNVIGCAKVERNVFVNSVALQNRGYAYMPIN